MSGLYTATQGPVPGFEHLTAITLASPHDDPAALASTWIPGAGMVGSSLLHRGQEVLGQRGGLGAYLTDAKTFGIPLLAPWANRLGSDEYVVADRTVSVTGVPGVHRDANGLPIHGLLAGVAGWSVDALEADETGARLVASLQFDESRLEFPAFPFPHELQVVVELAGDTLAVTTAVTPTSDVAVPVAFGWHPYFTVPGVDRQSWQVDFPFTSHVQLDERNLPTGDVVTSEHYTGPLGERTYDDLYTDVSPGTQASVSGSGRIITFTYVSGYDYAVLYAPADAPLLAIEPMTAATNPFSGPFDVQYATPGGRYLATFTVTVTGDDATGNEPEEDE